jgi:hypothetical protein
MKPGDRIIFYPAYIEPGRSRLGTIKAITGASALILFEDCGWVQGAPLARLEPWTPLAEEGGIVQKSFKSEGDRQ